MEFKVSLGESRPPHPPLGSGTPFHLAVLGDLSGRASRAVHEVLSGRRIWTVDCDTFDEVFTRLEVRLWMTASSGSETSLDLRFSGLEDFHPDELLCRVPQLAALLERRRQLLDPATAQAAADELRTLLNQPSAPAPSTPGPTAPSESDGDTLTRLLGDKPKTSAQPVPVQGGADISGLIRSLVGPSTTSAPTPRQTALLSALDLELASRLRAILHHPHFQALESAWRGVDRLVREFGGEDNVKIHLIDVSREELLADLQAQENLSQTGLCQFLRRGVEVRPWAVLLGLYTFDAELKDLQALDRIARISALVGAPFLAAANPHLVGCESFHTQPDPDLWTSQSPAGTREAWNALRALPEASYLGLGLPRFLLRQPYGRDGDPLEAFPFEELPADLPHESFLWGNPAILCAHALADAFRAEGWTMQASGYAESGDLPVYRFKQDGEGQVKPCAEAWLTERAGDAISAKGLIPLLSIKGRDAVRLANLQSLRSPPAPLAGRWR